MRDHLDDRTCGGLRHQVLGDGELVAGGSGETDVERTVVDGDGGVAGEEGVKVEGGELVDAGGGLLDRAIVDVLENDAPAVKNGVASEEVAPVKTVEEVGGVASAMAGGVEDLEIESTDADAVALGHLAIDLDRLEGVVGGVEAGGLGHVEGDGALIAGAKSGGGIAGGQDAEVEALAEAGGTAGVVHVVMGED